jgi:hypothetical protein
MAFGREKNGEEDNRSVLSTATRPPWEDFAKLPSATKGASAHLWPWCSGKHWSRDEKDRVMVDASQALAVIAIEVRGN